jgi:hypothetical protein
MAEMAKCLALRFGNFLRGRLRVFEVRVAWHRGPLGFSFAQGPRVVSVNL